MFFSVLLKQLLGSTGMSQKALDNTVAVLVALPDAITRIVHVAQNDALDAEHKATKTTKIVAHFLDDALDKVPEWAALPEAKRDSVIHGIRDLVVFLVELKKS